MRILHLLGVGRLSPNPDQQPLSGLTRTVSNIARAQAAQGISVSVATLDVKDWWAEWNGVHLFGIAPVGWAYLKFGNIKIDYRKHLAVVRFVKEHQFDVIQGHNYPYFRFIRIPKRVATFHGDPTYYGWSKKDFSTARRYCTHFVAVSKFVSSAVSEGLELPVSKVPVVHNGVDHTVFDSNKPDVIQVATDWRRRLGIASNQTVFLYAGAISIEKGTRDLALAFRNLVERIPEAVLVIAGSSHIWGGSGDKRELTSFEREIQDILRPCVQHVRFLDNVPGDSMPAVYAMADIIVVPSQVKEGFGLTALESLTCGRPVIAAQVGGLPEIVSSECGILVEPCNILMLSSAMEELATKPDLRLEKGKYGAERAKDFSWESAAQKLSRVYETL